VGRARFGTDGIRGVANGDLTAELALALGRAAATVIGDVGFVVGRDTRRSGPMLQSALAAGLASEGADVIDVGVLSTPGVAYCAASRGLAGAVISASHNPFEDNGIKLFAPGGGKLTFDVEREIEQLLDAPGRTAVSRPVGGITTDESGAAEYTEHLAGALFGRRLDGLSIVLDCANGAASLVAPAVAAALGAEIRTIACDPDGLNINDGCGSTHPEALAREVRASGADLGLAFDGDADRVVAVDHLGEVADGDTMLALFALDLAERKELTGDAVAVTVMSNYGFRLAMAERGITVIETPVGDRSVLAAVEEHGLALGGEQSGHVVFRRLATTGDGILTGLLLADLVKRQGEPLADLTRDLVERVPQVLVNVPVLDPAKLAGATAVWEEVALVEEELGDAGRVLLRSSGTEPLVRVMVEALSEDQAIASARRLGAVVAAALGTDRR